MSGPPRRQSYVRFSAAICICAGIFLALNEHGRAISNGKTISEGDSIRLVTVSVYSSDDDCSGVKIASNLILTAKHCIIGKSTKAVFGNGSSYAITDRFAPYSEVSRVNVEHDVAVLRIDRDVPGPVAELSNKSTVPKDGAIAWTAGYGGKQVTETSNPLRKAQVAMTNANYSTYLMAVKVEKGRGVCDGDSGAPGYIESTLRCS